MGTQAQPESNSSEQEQQNSEQGEQQNSESQSQPTPPTPSPQGTPIESEAQKQARYIALLEENQRDMNRRIQELLNQSTRPASQPTAPPPRNVEADRQQFYNDPVEATRTIVKSALDESVRPLVEFVQEMRSGRPQINAYDRIKGMLKVHPTWGEKFTPEIEAVVDQYIAQQPSNVPINEQLVQAAVVQALGLQAAGLLPSSTTRTPTPAAPPVPQPNNQPIPPNFRPSNPPMPNNNQPRRQVQLTELQRRLARERNMSDEEYAAWLDVPADRVATSDIGKPKGGR